MDQFATLTERILKGSAIILVFALLTTPLGYLLRILHSQTLSVDNYGLLYSVIALFTMITTYNDLGLSFSVSYFAPKFMKKKKLLDTFKLFKYTQIVGTVSSILIAVALALFAPFLEQNYFKAEGAASLIYIFSAFLICSGFLHATNAIFVGLQQEKYYSSMLFTRFLITLLLSAILLALGKGDIFTYSMAFVIGYISSVVIYNFFLYRKFSFLKSQKLNWDSKFFKRMLAYAVPTLITSSIYSFIIFTDTFFLTLFKGVREVGIYNIALPLASISIIAITPLNNLFLPLISHLVDDEKDKVSHLFNITLKIIPFIGLYFGLFIAMFPSIIISLLFGSKWLGLVEIPLVILSLGYIPALLASYFTTFVMGMGKVQERFKASMIIASISLIINSVLIYFFGVVGATIGTSIVHVLTIILLGRIVNQTLSFKYPFIFYIKIIAISLAIYYLVKTFNFSPNSWISLITAGIIYTLIMLIISYYLNVFDKGVLRFIFRKRQ